MRQAWGDGPFIARCSIATHARILACRATRSAGERDQRDRVASGEALTRFGDVTEIVRARKC
jgi:hypothetical protein